MSPGSALPAGRGGDAAVRPLGSALEEGLGTGNGAAIRCATQIGEAAAREGAGLVYALGLVIEPAGRLDAAARDGDAEGIVIVGEGRSRFLLEGDELASLPVAGAGLRTVPAPAPDAGDAIGNRGLGPLAQLTEGAG